MAEAYDGTSKDSDKLPFDKLMGEANWPIWRMQMKVFFEANNSYDIVTGEETCPIVPELPVEPTPAQTQARTAAIKELKSWKTRDAKARHQMIRLLSSNLQYLVCKPDFETAHSFWQALIAQFEKDTASNKLQILSRLMRFKQTSEMSTEEYYRKYTDMMSRLTALRCDVSDDIKLAFFVEGLSDQYESTRAAYLAKGDFSVAQLLEAVRSEESRRSNDMPEVTLYGQVPQKPKSGATYTKSSGTCYNCGQSDHYAGKCPHPKTQKQKAYEKSRKSKKTRQKQSVNSQQSNHQLEHSESDSENDNNLSQKKSSISKMHCGWSLCHELSAQSIETKMKNKLVIVLDSGATAHMFRDRNLFHEFESINDVNIKLGNGTLVKAAGKGTVIIEIERHHKLHTITLYNCLFVPDLVTNYVSVSVLTDHGMSIVFRKSVCNIIDDVSGKIVGHAVRYGKMYTLCCTAVNNDMACYMTKADSKANTTNTLNAQDSLLSSSSLALWHNRTGHCGVDRLEKAVKKNLVHGIEISGTLTNCISCVKGKMVRSPFPAKDKMTVSHVLERVHSDVCGPFQTKSTGGNRYFATFTDEYSRWSEVYPMCHKSDLLAKLKEYEAMVTTKHGHKIKALRTDCGGSILDTKWRTG